MRSHDEPRVGVEPHDGQVGDDADGDEDQDGDGEKDKVDPPADDDPDGGL